MRNSLYGLGNPLVGLFRLSVGAHRDAFRDPANVRDRANGDQNIVLSVSVDFERYVHVRNCTRNEERT